MQGQIINGFELKRLLGRGGMAEVWYAENEIGKPAAVKVLNENLSNYQQIVERFHNEALVMVKLDHPNIRQVYGYGYLGNRHCIIMEYLEGEDMEAMMKAGRHFTDKELQRWWDQTVDALDYTHAMGIVHRDIKPSNLFLDKRGNIKLLDFGIAKVKESISLTQTGALLGTLMYMSPEQVKDTKNIDYRTDIYSLAVTFSQLVSGNCPYDSNTSGDFEIRERIVYKPLDLSGLPNSWQGFLAPYLNKEPDKRPALRHFEAVMPTTEMPTMLIDKLTETVAVEAKKTIAVPALETQLTSQQPPVVETPTVLIDKLTGTVAVETKVTVAEPAREPQPLSQQQSMVDNPTIISTPETPNAGAATEKPQKKVGLWIGIGVGALAVLVVALVLFLKLREKSIRNEADNQAYQACVTANDYRSYMHEFGSEGLHYNEAKAEVDRLVADSTAKALQAIAEEQARLQAEAEARAKAEAELIEDKFFENCTSIAACDNYLEAYPQGRYVTEVEVKKAELKKAAEQSARKAARKAGEKKKATEKAAKKQQELKKESNTKTLKKPNADKKSGAPKVKINKPGK
jgi:serine/threonine protein kinase